MGRKATGVHHGRRVIRNRVLPGFYYHEGEPQKSATGKTKGSLEKLLMQRIHSYILSIHSIIDDQLLCWARIFSESVPCRSTVVLLGLNHPQLFCGYQFFDYLNKKYTVCHHWSRFRHKSDGANDLPYK
jgi:hypothetical protein